MDYQWCNRLLILLLGVSMGLLLPSHVWWHEGRGATHGHMLKLIDEASLTDDMGQPGDKFVAAEEH